MTDAGIAGWRARLDCADARRLGDFRDVLRLMDERQRLLWALIRAEETLRDVASWFQGRTSTRDALTEDIRVAKEAIAFAQEEVK